MMAPAEREPAERDPRAVPAADELAPPFDHGTGYDRRLAREEHDVSGSLGGFGSDRPLRLIPGRPAHLGAPWLSRVNSAGGPVRVRVA